MRTVPQWREGRERRFLRRYFRRFGVEVGISAWFEPRDIWVGVFWCRSESYTHTFNVYICLVPTFPVVLEVSGYGRWQRKVRRERARETQA